MLGKLGVGKGLNVKGKSAKKNRLSGFVPFCQISNNADKSQLEPSPPNARTHIYYRTKASREIALTMLTKALKGLPTNAVEEEGKKIVY